jgi:tetratricopeptide (TPR) repeat protein
VALEAALEHPGRLTDYERYHTEGLHAMTVGDIARGLAAYRTLLEMDPRDAAALNNIALAYAHTREWERAREALEAGVQVNLKETEAGTPVFGPTFSALAIARWNLGDRAGAWAVLDLLAEQDPNHPFDALSRGALSAAAFEFAAAEGHFSQLLARHGNSPFLHVLARRTLAATAAARGQVRSAVDQLARSAELQEREQQRWEDGGLGDGIRVALLQSIVLGDREAGQRTLAAYRIRFPLTEIPAEDVPYASLATAYAAAGQSDSAGIFIDRLRTWPAAWHQRASPHALPAAEGAVALEEGRFDDAIAAFQRAQEVVPHCEGCYLAPLGVALQGAGRPDSAIVVLTRYLEMGWAERILGVPVFTDGDQLYLGLVLERLAELHEERGERELAARYYRRLIELWERADPELQPRVQAARRALGRAAQEGTTPTPSGPRPQSDAPAR